MRPQVFRGKNSGSGAESGVSGEGVVAGNLGQHSSPDSCVNTDKLL